MTFAHPDMFISVVDYKKQLSQVIRDQKTKIIMKNNEPVQVSIPYADYVAQQHIHSGNGSPITLENGVTITTQTVVENNDIVTRTYIQMKTTKEYKLLYTHRLSAPSVEQTLTTEEWMQEHLNNTNIEG